MKVIYLWCLSLTSALMPSKLPSGKIKKYVANKDSKQDIVVIDYQKASLISRNWLENILNYEIEKRISELNNMGHDNHDNHIIMKINQLETLIQDNNKYIYLAWMPKCIYGSNDVLFLIVCQQVNEDTIIKLIIQSPFWSHEQINSQMLKEALCSYVDHNINLKELYDNDIRYKLSWCVWYLNH